MNSWPTPAFAFAAELRSVQDFLSARGFRAAVIGGVALAAYGHPRMTLDLDIVTESAAQDAVVAFMESRGFATLHRSPGYSNHRHPERRHGRVDSSTRSVICRVPQV